MKANHLTVWGLLLLAFALTTVSPDLYAQKRRKSKLSITYGGSYRYKTKSSFWDLFRSNKNTSACPAFYSKKNKADGSKGKETDPLTPLVTHSTPKETQTPQKNIEASTPTPVLTMPTTPNENPEPPLERYLRPLYFVFDEDQLTAEDLKTLQTAANYAKENYFVVVEGHTDNLGEDTYNDKLSQKRALRIKNILVNQLGVPQTHVEAKGFGEQHPAVPNTDPQARQLNRRVEIKIVQPSSQLTVNQSERQ